MKEKIIEFLFKLLKGYVEEVVLKKANVNGVGLGYKNDTKELCITVLVERKKTNVKQEDEIPSRILGIKTDVVEIGCIELTNNKLPLAPDTKTHRPLIGGIEITADGLEVGTLGLIVPAWKNERGRLLTGNILRAMLNVAASEGKTLEELGCKKASVGITNTHVIDNNDGVPAFGKRVRHPRRNGKTIGHVFTGFDIREGSVRNKDFAMIDLSMHENWVKQMHMDYVGDIKQETVKPKVGDYVRTKGRTSGYWDATVTNTNVTMSVRYRFGGKDTLVKFRDCVLTNKGITGGNSGSIFVTEDNKIHSLIFAGSAFRGVSHELTWLPDYLGWGVR